MKLYHYTDICKPTLIISPNHFGENSYSRDEMKSLSIPRSFWYLNPNDKESMVKDRCLYVAEVSNSTIYNLNKDPQKIDNEAYSLEEYVNRVITKGYKGVRYGETSGMEYPVVSMFVDVPAKLVQNNSVVYSVKNIKRILEGLVEG